MTDGLRLRTAKYAPVLGLAVLFLVSVAFSLSAAVTRQHVATTAVFAGATLAVGGLSILRNPWDAARYDTALTSLERGTVPGRSAVTLMTASGFALSLAGFALVSVALRVV